MRPHSFLIVGLLALFVPLHAVQAAVDGFNSIEGPLPLGAGGTASMWIWPQEGSVPMGAVGIGTGGDVSNKPNASLEVHRGVKIGTDEKNTSTTDLSCPEEKRGTLSFRNNMLSFCDGVSWRAVPAQ